MLLKKISLVALSVSFMAAPMLAKADLSIMNNTNSPSTSIINNGACSTILGPVGTTKPKSPNKISHGVIQLACSKKFPCKADVYMTPDCKKSGKSPVATVSINKDDQVLEIANHNVDGFTVSGVGTSRIEFNGGAHLATK